MHTDLPTAVKTSVEAVKNSELVKEDGREWAVIDGEKTGRVNIIGTVMHKFHNKERMFVFLNLDDGTGVISLRAFKESASQLENIQVGDMVRVIAGVREYEKSVYLSPSSVKKLKDPNEWLLRKLELARKKPKFLKNDKDKVIEELKKNKDGMGFEELKKNTGLDAVVLENIVNELLEKGEVYEPKPDKLRILE